MLSEKMNWKEFLKPDKRKISVIIVLSIFVFLFFFYFYAESRGLTFDNRIIVALLFSGQLFLVPITFVTSNILFPILESSYGHGTAFSIANIVQRVLIPIYVYLLSCLIIWIYDKLKKK